MSKCKEVAVCRSCNGKLLKNEPCLWKREMKERVREREDVGLCLIGVKKGGKNEIKNCKLKKVTVNNGKEEILKSDYKRFLTKNFKQ